MNNFSFISVICSSFNHEKYVDFFINSLIKQTYKNWELIIIDDCSTDNNIFEIKKIQDDRIRFYKQDVNSGSGIVNSKAFSFVKGDIIVDCASDDALREDYFAKLIEVFNEKKNVGVVYSSLNIIDDKNIITGNWNLPQKNRIELLRHLFYKGNCLFSPGMAVRRDVYKLLVPMNFAIVQHQDYQWHIKLLLNTDCELLPDYYVFYRYFEKGAVGLSTQNSGGVNRRRLEEDVLMDTFLSVKDIDLCAKIISLSDYKKEDAEFIPFLFAKAALNSCVLEKRQWGYKTIIKFFESTDAFNKVNHRYGFEFKDLLKLSCENYYEYVGVNDKLAAYEKFMNSGALKKCWIFVKFMFSQLTGKIKSKRL